MIDQYQSVFWPGVAACDSCEYTNSHGITPGRAILITYPSFADPDEFGDLAFTDGKNAVAIVDCKVEKMTTQYSNSSGVSYILEIVDRRWRWATGQITGHYNQKDSNGKLVPWTIRSPKELAQLCLDAMGENNPYVNLPNGLGKAAGANVEKYLRLGENYPQTLTNPEVVWDHTNPAQALVRLIEPFGCRLIYQHVFDRIVITTLGTGLPFGSLPAESLAPNIDAPPAPAALAAFSVDPVKIQCRFLLQAVGKEWDGSYVPINQLSYAPSMTTGENMVVAIEETGDGTGKALYVSIYFKLQDGSQSSVSVSSLTTGTNASKYSAIAAALNADPGFAKVMRAMAFATGVNIRYNIKGTFSIQVLDPATGAASDWVKVTIITPGGEKVNTWASCLPPLWGGIQATDRLSVQEARGLADESVFRCYRILNRDPHDINTPYDKPGRPLKLPWYGLIKRRQQIVLQDTKVEQVVPAPRIPGAINKGNSGGIKNGKIIPNGGVLPEFYNGYSRAQSATVTGSVWKKMGSSTVLYWIDPDKPGENTDEKERVFVGFTIDAVEQFVKFNGPVWHYRPGVGSAAYADEPKLTLETGVYVLDANNNQFVKWEQYLKLPNGAGPIEWFPLEDMKVGIIGKYGMQNVAAGFDYDGVQDANQRAGFYLRGQATKYQLKAGDIRQLIGIYPFDPDGYCQQVTLKVGPGGPTTILSGNTEYHPFIPPYPARRRPENLPADKTNEIANKAERLSWDANRADK